MKKIISLVLTIALTISSMICVNAADEGIKVYLEGNKINFDVQPQTINGRTMVPIRAIFEAMGANVTWDDATQSAISTKNNTTVKMTLNSTTEYINGVACKMDVTPVIIDGRTLAPARYVAEAFGYTVNWDEASQSVMIVSNSNTLVFDELKNIIISKGSFKNGYYGLVAFIDESGMYSMYYRPAEDSIHLYLGSEIDENWFTMLIIIERYKKPGFLYTNEFSSGNKYEVFAEYPQFNKTYSETENTFPDYLHDATEKSINADLKFIDICTKNVANISLSDFGIYYEQ